MKLDRVILSSNDDPKYLDFWPFVSKAWRELIGIEPVLFFIGEHSKVAELSKWGQVIQFPVDPLWDIVNQSQSIRLYAGSKFPDENLIISDLDMLPINREYFNSLSEYNDDSFISYTSDVIQYGFYLRSPQFPMCYLAAKGSTFNEILGISTSTTWENFLLTLKNSSMGYGTDQKYFYSKFIKWAGKDSKYIGLNRGWIDGKIAKNRLDRVNWPNTKEYQINNYYDCHLPLPFSIHKDRCLELFNKLNLVCKIDD